MQHLMTMNNFIFLNIEPSLKTILKVSVGHLWPADLPLATHDVVGRLLLNTSKHSLQKQITSSIIYFFNIYFFFFFSCISQPFPLFLQMIIFFIIWGKSYNDFFNWAHSLKLIQSLKYCCFTNAVTQTGIRVN